MRQTPDLCTEAPASLRIRPGGLLEATFSASCHRCFVHPDHFVLIQIEKVLSSPSDAQNGSDLMNLINCHYTNGCAPGSYIDNNGFGVV